MKLPSVFSCTVLILLLLSSSSATSSALQNQAVREQELSAALRAGNGVIIIGGTDDFVFTFRARNRIHRHLAIQDDFGDPILMNGFGTTTIIPPAMVLSTTLPEGALCLTRLFGDRLMCNSEFYACKKQAQKNHP